MYYHDQTWHKIKKSFQFNLLTEGAHMGQATGGAT